MAGETLGPCSAPALWGLSHTALRGPDAQMLADTVMNEMSQDVDMETESQG